MMLMMWMTFKVIRVGIRVIFKMMMVVMMKRMMIKMVMSAFMIVVMCVLINCIRKSSISDNNNKENDNFEDEDDEVYDAAHGCQTEVMIVCKFGMVMVNILLMGY